MRFVTIKCLVYASTAILLAIIFLMYTDVLSGKNASVLDISLDSGTIFKPPGEAQHSSINATVRVVKVKTLGLSFKSFEEALVSRASDKKDIILALMDLATLPMAVNFWEISLVAHNIDNYLFVSSNNEACQKLITELRIPCYLYREDKASAKKSIYMSADFKRKMNIRTYMILEALELGYNVLHTDVDEVWFKNPLTDFRCDGKCDVAALWDCGAMNAGFVYVRPTPLGIALYKHMSKTAHTTTLDDQTAFNQALGALKGKLLRLLRLPDNKYQCGMRYYEQENRTFAGDNPCKDCVVAHNNWIVSLEAKTYRFKENHQWLYDGGGYYSDPGRKYISYGNPYGEDIKKATTYDIEGLKNAFALGEVLNRTVILPKFHCRSETNLYLCSLLDHLKVRDLDKVFLGKYREHTFLTHPKVPDGVKNSMSKVIVIHSNLQKQLVPRRDCPNCIELEPEDRENGATLAEIRDWFQTRPESVLKFQSLYRVFSIKDMDANFQRKLAMGFRPGTYRQF